VNHGQLRFDRNAAALLGPHGCAAGYEPADSDAVGQDSTLYDDYLDACLAGTARRPDEVFAEHPELEEEMRERIRALYEAWSARDRASLPFERLGDFRLLQRLDSGGMGAVFVAEQESLGRVVALKIMRPEWAGDVQAVRRFSREAQAVAQLRHPGIVTVYDAGADGDTQYLAMELVPGKMMSDILAEAARTGEVIPVDRVVRWGARLARALEYAHGRGIVHRDVKPHNIRVTPDDRPMLLDFGIAHDLTGAGQTITQSFQGSPTYAAPEQIQGGSIDPRTDVYALGVTLYQALTGAAPFEAATVEGIFHKVLTEVPTAPRRIVRSVSADLETVILKAMEKRPEARYESAGTFAEDLEAVLAFRPVRARPPRPLTRAAKWARRKPARAVAILSACVLALVIGGLAVARHAQDRRERLAEAERLRDRAVEAVAAYRTERSASETQEAELAQKRLDVNNRYFTREEDRALATLAESVQQGRRRREALFHEALTSLGRAERLDPELGGTDTIRARLYVEKWEEARTARDPMSQAFFRKQAELYDPDGAAAAPFAHAGALLLELATPETTCWLFGFREQRELVPGGGRRLVPVPVGAEEASPPAPHGATVLRVIAGAGALAEGDLVLEVLGHGVGDTLFVEGKDQPPRVLEAVDDKAIHGMADLEEALESQPPHRFRVAGEEHTGADLASLGLSALLPEALAGRGHVAARVLIGGAVRGLRLPPGLRVRLTAIPLYCTPSAHLNPGRRSLPAGVYVVVARAPGHEEARRAAVIKPDATTTLRVELAPAGTTPRGFVSVPADGRSKSFFIMEREVTCAEYLAFLEDPAIRPRITVGQRTLVPRGPLGAWAWQHDGTRFQLDKVWQPDTPVMGVSFGDALAYARWRSEQDGVRHALPTEQQWNRASGYAPFQRRYPFGNVFSPKWVSSNWARPRARPEPSFRYPIDESPYGVFATSGSAMEWLDAWWDKDTKEQRWLAGGAWGYANPALFLVPGGWGSKPDQTTGTYGFRLVRAR